MQNRPTMLFPLITGALLALLTLWIDRVVQPPAPKLDGSNRHDPDYLMNNFVTTKTDLNGDLQYKLAATEMKHYPDDDSTQLTRPRFTRYAVNKPYTQIEGQRGLVSSNGENIEFLDKVKVVRQAFEGKGEMTVLTEKLTLHPKKDLAITDLPVIITQAPKTVIHATGMIFDKKNKAVTLLHHVKVHYENPRKSRSVAAPQANIRSEDAMKLEGAIGKPSLEPRSKVMRSPSKKTAPKLNLSKEII